MNIQEGCYYVRESEHANDVRETYLLWVLPPQPWTPKEIVRTETLAMHANNELWQNDWVRSFIQREATLEEMEHFQAIRKTKGAKLQSYGELLRETAE